MTVIMIVIQTVIQCAGEEGDLDKDYSDGCSSDRQMADAEQNEQAAKRRRKSSPNESEGRSDTTSETVS